MNYVHKQCRLDVPDAAVSRHAELQDLPGEEHELDTDLVSVIIIVCLFVCLLVTCCVNCLL